LLQRVLDQHRLHRPDALLIEDKGSGTSQIQDLLHRYQIRALPILPIGDKVVRMDRAALSFEQGLVHFPKDALGSPNWKTNCCYSPTRLLMTRSIASRNTFSGISPGADIIFDYEFMWVIFAGLVTNGC
jgi:hypothetical protein